MRLGTENAPSDRDTDATVSEEQDARQPPARRDPNPPGTVHVSGRACGLRSSSGASVTAGWALDVTCPECLGDERAMREQRDFEIGECGR